jgi:hypothetical protein
MTKARDLSNIISGGFTADDIPNLDASKITTGEIANARVADLPASKITSGTFANDRISESSVSQHATSFDDNAIVNDISTLALTQASNDNRSAYNTNSQFVDVFQDASGLDTLTNASRDGNEFVSSLSNWGTYSGSFTGSVGALRYGANSRYVIGTGDFTVEWWQKTSSTSYMGVYGTTNEASWTTDGWHVGYSNSNLYIQNNTDAIGNQFPITNSHDNNWHHMAIVRQSGTIRAYRDGVASATTNSSLSSVSLGNASFRVVIGANEPGGNQPYSGLLDDFRFSDICRYPDGTTFSTPSQFSSDSNTILLQNFENSNFSALTGASATVVNLDSNINSVVSQSSTVHSSSSATGNFTGTTITAPSSVSSMGAIITYQDNAGTNALNTDIVLELSADNGSNWSTATLGALPNFSTGIKMAKVNDLAVTAGTQLKYRLNFANQSSGSKEARIRGVALQY